MIVVVLGLMFLPSLVKPDPVPGLTVSREVSRRLECEHVSAEVGKQRYPGIIETERPRGDFLTRSALICAERLVRPGLRPDRDEAILSTLEDTVTDVSAGAADRYRDLAGRTWLVDAFYPSAQVTAKLVFATKNALAAQGLQVSDRAPLLSAGDLDVILRMAPDEAFPAACARWAANGSLRPQDALFAVVSRDARETILHGGVCVDGRWSWLR